MTIPDLLQKHSLWAYEQMEEHTRDPAQSIALYRQLEAIRPARSIPISDQRSSDKERACLLALLEEVYCDPRTLGCRWLQDCTVCASEAGEIGRCKFRAFRWRHNRWLFLRINGNLRDAMWAERVWRAAWKKAESGWLQFADEGNVQKEQSWLAMFSNREIIDLLRKGAISSRAPFSVEGNRAGAEQPGPALIDRLQAPDSPSLSPEMLAIKILLANSKTTSNCPLNAL